jgi:hypothetical protein
MADEERRRTKREKLGAAIEALQELLDRRLEWAGGYPAEIIGPYRGLLFVADISDDSPKPQGTVIDITNLVQAYDMAIAAAIVEAAGNDDPDHDPDDDPDDYFADAFYGMAMEPDDCEACPEERHG